MTQKALQQVAGYTMKKNRYNVYMKDRNGVRVNHFVDAYNETAAKKQAEIDRDDCLAISAKIDIGRRKRK